MGCLKLTYRQEPDFRVIYSKKELTSNKSILNERSDYLYGFNGQEKDDEVKGQGNSYNFTFRMSNPRLGRFFAIDPLVKSYPWYSPYQFAGNQVIKARELEGLEPDVDVNLQATVVIAFGSGGQSNTRISFGAGFSAKGGTNDASAQTSINFAFTLSDGGLGTTQGSSGQNQFQGSFVISPALTIGGGTGKALPTNTFTSSTITGVNNTFNTSFTIGQNFVIDSKGRNQRVGFFGARFEKFNVGLFNDTKKQLGDGFDRFNTGGGGINVLFGDGNIASFGTEVFTGEVDMFDKKGNPKREFSNPNANFGTYVQSVKQRSLNNGQTFIRMQTSNGMRFGLNVTGNFGGLNPGWMQNLIHNTDAIKTPFFNFKDAKGSIQGEIGTGTPID